VLTSPDGVVTVVGGKLTTYRRMARDAVDAALSGRLAGRSAGPSRTARLPLAGAAPAPVLARVPAPARLVARYGTEAPLVLGLAGQDTELAAPVADGLPTIAAEFAFSVAHEGALDPGDLLDRRTRIGLVPDDRRRAMGAAVKAMGVKPVADQAG
jgi:glycerol-3-phosphate dehydrogenase